MAQIGQKGEENSMKTDDFDQNTGKTTLQNELLDALLEAAILTKKAAVLIAHGKRDEADKYLELADRITFPMQLLLADLEKVERLPLESVRFPRSQIPELQHPSWEVPTFKPPFKTGSPCKTNGYDINIAGTTYMPVEGITYL